MDKSTPSSSQHVFYWHSNCHHKLSRVNTTSQSCIHAISWCFELLDFFRTCPTCFTIAESQKNHNILMSRTIESIFFMQTSIFGWFHSAMVWCCGIYLNMNHSWLVLVNVSNFVQLIDISFELSIVKYPSNICSRFYHTCSNSTMSRYCGWAW